mgnify:CR=1 FL=1
MKNRRLEQVAVEEGKNILVETCATLVNNHRMSLLEVVGERGRAIEL